jgi:hypothetical protein
MSTLNLHHFERLIAKFIPLNQAATVNPYALSAGITASYVLLYTGYSKADKTLDPKLLVDFFLVRRGWDWTLKEANKVISLSGLTSVLLAFLPEFKANRKELLFVSGTLLWTHSVYSFYSFYQFSLATLAKQKQIKQISVALGALGQLALSAAIFGDVSKEAIALATTALSIAHFWTMEVDFKWVLQVRPYAYLPFPLSGLVVLRNWFIK